MPDAKFALSESESRTVFDHYTPRYYLQIAPGLYFQMTEQPNWFHRWWQNLLLGWQWRKLP